MAASAQDPFAAIAEVVEWSDGLALILVVGPELRELEGTQAIRACLPADRHVLVHRLDRDGPDIAATIAAAHVARPVVLVRGLAWMDARQIEESELQLNLLRDSLVAKPAAVVIWIPERELPQFQSRCPDLYHFRSLVVNVTTHRLPLHKQWGSEALRRYLQWVISTTHWKIAAHEDGTAMRTSAHTPKTILVGDAETAEAAVSAMAWAARRLAQDRRCNGVGPVPLWIDAWILRELRMSDRSVAHLLTAALGNRWNTTIARDLKQLPLRLFIFVPTPLGFEAGRIEATFALLDALVEENPDTQIVVIDHDGTLPRLTGWSRITA